MPWYETQVCFVCKKKIGKLYFWNDKPKIINSAGNKVEWKKLDEAQINEVLKDNKPVCYPCYTDRLRDLLDLLGVES